ncbi:MAG: hypothetical protein ACOCY7_05090 [Halodesulfurarchaeum sp.]
MNRRALLSTCVTLLFGGCPGSDRSPPSKLAWIWLRNDREESYEVDVIVADDGEIVFSEQYELGSDRSTAQRNVDDPVGGSGRYVVRVTMDGETREVDTTRYVDGEEDCIGVRFSLLDNGDVDFWVKSMQRC